MKDKLLQLLPTENLKRAWAVAALTAFIAGLMTVWGIYAIGEYGIALFIFTPFFLGASATLLYGAGRVLTRTDSVKVCCMALVLYFFGILFTGVEGLICILMAAPIGLVLTLVGAFFGYAVHTYRSGSASLPMILLLLLSMPMTAFMERGFAPELSSVVTSVEIDAPPAAVWPHVIRFPQLPEPTEWLFKAGIAYPTHAHLEGDGVGAIRYCQFTTGSFVEPITTWQEPHLLQFDVLEQPDPMKELSFWDINAPHLHDYFVSKRGQFSLVELPGNRTRLEGTTWYYHRIRPAFYWRVWSHHIVQKIHARVLTHIKHQTEKSALVQR